MKNVVLLLTGTVTPQIPGITVTDPNFRVNEYLNSVMWYLANTPYKVVFAENSGYSTFESRIQGADLSRFEFFTYKESNTKIGAGYNEWEILKRAKQESTFVKNADVIVKCTGCLILKNIKCHVNQALKYNSPFFIGDYAPDFQSMTTTFLIFSPDLYDDLLSVRDKITKERYIELAIMDFVHKQAKLNPDSVLFFKRPLLISGVSGHYGNVYDTPWYKLPIRYLYRIVRVVRWNKVKRNFLKNK